MWKRIFSNSFFLPQYSIFLKILYAEHTHTICTCTLSMRLRIVGVCSAYAYESYAYAQHTRTEKHIKFYMDGTRMLSIRLRMVCVC